MEDGEDGSNLNPINQSVCLHKPMKILLPSKANRVRTRVFIVLAAVLVLGCAIPWLLPTQRRPLPAQLAQDIAEISRLIRERIGQHQTNYALSIDVETDRTRAFVRAVSDQSCTTYELLQTGSEWRRCLELSWAVPCPLSQQDVTEITRLARSDASPPILQLSWNSLRQLPSAIAQRWSYRILSLDALTNGTHMAQVRIGTRKRGTTYRLINGPGYWALAEKRAWLSQ
jgi:hypothetical protein